MDNLQFRYKKLISIYLCSFSLMLCYVQSAAEHNYGRKCAPGLITVGWTDPASDINIELGNPLQIFCSLNLSKVEGNSASNIVFYCNGTTISSQYVTVLNQSTSLLYIPSPSISQCMYYCKLITNSNAAYPLSSLESSSSSQVYETNEKLVCVNNVVVGTKPAPAENISCVSYDLEKFVCTWNAPYNPIKTEYNASYKIKLNADYYMPCPENTNIRYSNNCTWTLESNPLYRRSYEILYVTVTAKNIFGESSVLYNFSNYARIVMSSPSDLMVMDKTTTSVCLSWNIHFNILFYKKLVYKIEYTWPGLNDWKSIEKHYDGANTAFKENITGLPYPNTLYDFRVYIRSGVAKNASDIFWSEPATIVVKTKPCAPYRPPKTVTGAFEIPSDSDGERDVYVYWQSLLPEENNGDEFRYEVIGKMLNEENGEQRQRIANNATVDIKPILVANAYAKFSNLSSSSYRFRITSVNKEGSSPTSSEIFLPASDDIIREPAHLTNTDSGNDAYEIFWQHSPDWKNITNFTVFWCDNGRDQPQWCEGNLDFASLPPNANTFNMNTSESKKTFKFAISANSDRSSSGMIRATCNVLPGKISKIRTVWINKNGPNFMEVNWKLECFERKRIKGFYLFYSASNESERNITVPFDESSILNVGNITDLKPYTPYKIAVAGFSEEIVGPRSDELLVSTPETSPDTSNSNVTKNVTDTTISLNWNPPKIMNGIFKGYEILYNNRKLTTKNTNITLTHLKPYTEYDVKIFACTTSCSEVFNKSILTAIGIPGIVNTLNYNQHNESTHNITWNAPSEPAGPFVNYYVTVYSRHTNISTTKTNRTELLIPIPRCEDDSYSVVVQSETIDNAGVERKGNLSDPHLITCLRNEFSNHYLFVYFIFFVGFVLIVFLLGRIGIRKCRKMKEIQVTLPPNFTIFDSPIMKDNNISNDCWPNKSESHHLKINFPETDYEDDIDTTIDMIRRADDDTDPYSSGCCTGRSSTTSSITGAGTHTSSDSGTEMELKAIDSSLSAEFVEENALPSNNHSVPAHETSLLIASTSASDLKWNLPATRFSYVSTSSDGGDCGWMYLPILTMNDATSTSTAAAPTTTTTTPGYVTINHFPSNDDHSNTIISHQISNNGYVTVVPKTPYSISQDAAAAAAAAAGTVPPPGYCRVTGK